MGSTLPLLMLLSLAPAQADKLQLTNARLTYGILGAERDNAKFLPGDVFCTTFDIEGLKADAGGNVSYKMGLVMKDKEGNKVYGRDPQEVKGLLSLGGSRIPAIALVEIGADTAPGEYTVAVTVSDQASKASDTLTKKFEVTPKGFGLVRVHTIYNFAGGPPAPAVGIAGQSYVVNFAAANFERDTKNKEPDVAVEMTVLDENDKPTLAKPFTGEFGKDVPANLTVMQMQFLLELNRVGKFTVKLKATDKIAKKTAELSFKLTVVDAK